MFERLDPLGIWLAAGQATFWLAFGLFASRRYAHRPARAHGLLLLAAGAAPLTPLLSGLAQLLGWGLLVGPEPACSFRVLQPQPAETPAWWLHLESPAWLLPRALLLGWAGISAWLVLRLVASLRAGGRCFGGGAPVDEP